MNAIRQKIFGRLFVSKAQTVLWVGDDTTAAIDLLYLRYGLTLRGTERPIFPAFALDDWGHEYNRLALYKWLRAEGERFPRAEIFGFDEDGREVQHFLREIELHWQYPLYAYPSKTTAIADGTPVTTGVITNDQLDAPARLDGRPTLSAPLRRARVDWWQAPANWMRESFTFSIFGQ